MSLFGTGAATIEQPNQINGAGSLSALNIEHYRGVVAGTIERKSCIKPYVDMQSVVGTTTITNFAVGESTLQTLIPGTIPDGTTHDQSKLSLTVDTVILARAIVPLISTFQTAYDARAAPSASATDKILWASSVSPR